MQIRVDPMLNIDVKKSTNLQMGLAGARLNLNDICTQLSVRSIVYNQLLLSMNYFFL